ncbi:hypothetical protein BDR04DRAFT_784470 [Suillus decipiens]|nr:hypothetical protein BDR04DRAFT_784470 [Suillus decipiens]
MNKITLRAYCIVFVSYSRFAARYLTIAVLYSYCIHRYSYLIIFNGLKHHRGTEFRRRGQASTIPL